MDNILELLYDLPRGKVHGQDSPFVRMARIKNENLELLTASMTGEQKDLLESYLEPVFIGGVAGWARDFVVLQGKKSQEYFVYFKIF